MHALLIGERMNLPRRESLDLRAQDDPHEWLELSARIGAFGTGISKNARGADKLKSIGLVWHDSLNLLPPSSVVGAWSRAQARQICNALVDLLVAGANSRYDLKSMGGRHVGMTLARWAAVDTIVLLGRRVERAFACAGTPYFDVLTSEGGYYKMLTAPHPSGMNRWWNDPENIVAARSRLAWMTSTK